MTSKNNTRKSIGGRLASSPTPSKDIMTPKRTVAAQM